MSIAILPVAAATVSDQERARTTPGVTSRRIIPHADAKLVPEPR